MGRHLRSFTAAFKLQVIEYAEEHGKREAGCKFDVDEKRVRYWTKQKDAFAATNRNRKAFRRKKCQYPELEGELVKYVIDTRRDCYAVSTDMIRVKALAIARHMEYPRHNSRQQTTLFWSEHWTNGEVCWSNIADAANVGPQLPLGTACGLLTSCGHYPGVVDLSLSLAKQVDPQGLALHFYQQGERPEDERGRQAYVARMECYKVIRDMLSELRASGDSRPDGSCYEAMLGLALRSDDETFHASLYDWLCESGQSARLLDVRSPFLEAYLQRRCDAADLLWKYHERVGNYGAAARILAKLADRPGTDVNLAKRLEYLARAIVCIKSTHFQVTNEGNFLYQLEEKLEVARLQAKVQDALRQRSDLPMAAELVARLDAELVDVTHLYGDYADPYDLAECKLAIVRSSGYDKPLLVESLWQSLLEREFLNNVRPDQLSQRLESLAQDYAQSEKFFPLAFLVKFLELRGSQHGFEPGWILEPLLGANVPISRLRDTYNDLYRGKDPAFTERSLHLLHAIARLLELFLNGCHCTDRRRLANRCINDIPGYLVDLQSMATRDNAVDSLISKFKEFQARLDRYVAA
ncbi:nuclear pore complex protein Nup155 [Rhipicephalus sanguineus]|uniref:nuclear pore complex protein Nup155 n=1 Tax=Rhipicephalus sanguineus TaxID=34632 RepID=UPI0020C40BE5|nr:nuclear pore complex protein Nup155 [Rhipicephalus sanguineus]